jgi:ubiquinone/menaquinone biosynthesis C-methylase UbiE
MKIQPDPDKRSGMLNELLQKRWADMDEEERLQETKYFEHYGNGERIKDVAGTFFDYYEKSNPFLSYFSWKKINCIVNQLKKKVDPRTARILDVGCGIAFFFKKLGPGENQYGIDISRLFINKAKQNAPWAHFIHSNAKRMPFEDDFFDFTICNDTLEHVRYPGNALAEIHRVTKKGPNRVVLSIPNEFISRIARVLNLRFPVKWPFHLHFITPEVLKRYFPRTIQSTQTIPINHLPWALTLAKVFIY